MREDICTIPISEAFEENDGCPICRMRKTVEERILDYIMGAAMMEPDVRIETNRLGFCKEHLGGMMKKRGRLPLALILESHAKELCDNIFSSSYQKNGLKAKQVHSTCFVCEKIEWGFERMINTIYLTYERDKEFRDLFDSQEFFCLEHYSLLAANSSKKVMRKYYSEFNKALEETVSKYLENLHSDLEKYCSMYDYRNNTENADWGTSKDSVERAALFLTGISE
ncbi:MAG: hypothetical protein IKK77_05170 [Clostridia bacterium]|nr:hypothetical protein [Clostridia bacterium]